MKTNVFPFLIKLVKCLIIDGDLVDVDEGLTPRCDIQHSLPVVLFYLTRFWIWV